MSDNFPKFIDSGVRGQLARNSKARVAYNLQKLIVVPMFFILVRFVSLGLEFHQLIPQTLFSTVIGYLIPLTFGGVLIAVGFWGLITGILPYGGFSDPRLRGWKPNFMSRVFGFCLSVIGFISVGLAIYFL